MPKTSEEDFQTLCELYKKHGDNHSGRSSLSWQDMLDHWGFTVVATYEPEQDGNVHGLVAMKEDYLYKWNWQD